MLVVYTASQVLEKLGAFDTYPAIDIPFHFLWGVSAAYAVDTITNHKLKVNQILAGTFAIGVAWEFYEVWRGLPDTGLTPNTLQDIIMDMLGATGYITLRWWPTENTLVPIEIDPKTK